MVMEGRQQLLHAPCVLMREKAATNAGMSYGGRKTSVLSEQVVQPDECDGIADNGTRGLSEKDVGMGEQWVSAP